MKRIHALVEFVKRDRVWLIALIAVMAFIMVAAPTTISSAASFSINTDTLLDNAATMFNALWPILAISIGLLLGVGLAKFLSSSFKNLFS